MLPGSCHPRATPSGGRVLRARGGGLNQLVQSGGDGGVPPGHDVLVAQGSGQGGVAHPDHQLPGAGTGGHGQSGGGVAKVVEASPSTPAARVAGIHTRRVKLLRGMGGFAGALVILAPWNASGSGAIGGALACLGAAASYGLSYVYMGRRLAGRGLSPLVLSAAQLTAATGLLVLVTPVAGLQPVQLTPTVVAAISILGALGTGAAYVLNYRLITDEGPTATSTVTYLLPVVAVALGIVFLGEPAAAHLLVGTGIVLVGIALVQRRTPAPVS